MIRLRYAWLAFTFGVLLVGCSGAASSGGGGNEGVYQENLGTADPQTLINDTREALLVRYGFRLEREVTSSEDVRFETEWKEESSLEDERALGATHARTRITITARPRNRSATIAQSYAVRYVAEAQLRDLGSDLWRSAPMTPMRAEYIKRIASFLKSEYRTALR